MAIPIEEFRSRLAASKSLFEQREYEKWYFKQCAKIVARSIAKIPIRIVGEHANGDRI